VVTHVPDVPLGAAPEIDTNVVLDVVRCPDPLVRGSRPISEVDRKAVDHR
jgi:hypothetical protein